MNNDVALILCGSSPPKPILLVNSNFPLGKEKNKRETDINQIGQN